METPNMPQEVKQAFAHIRKFFPDVCKVTFDEDGRWLYTDKEGNAPTFDSSIDVGILEDAADSLPYFAVSFSL